MFFLARMLLFWVFFTIIIYLRDTTTLADPPNLIAHACINNAGNYTENSIYKVNLDKTLSALLTTDSGFGYYNLSIGMDEDRVNSFALCRGDLEASLCQACLNDSITVLRQDCPNQKQAIGYYDECMLIYANDPLSGNTPVMNYKQSYMNDQNATDVDWFDGAVRPLLGELIADAADGSPLLKFATGNKSTGPGFGITRIYALVQCTPDLSHLQCNNCLEYAIKVFPTEFRRQVGGRTLLPLCNFRYEIKPFFNGSTLAISPPPSSGKKKTSIIAIIIIILAVAIVSLFIWIILIKTRRRTLQSPDEDILNIGGVDSLQYNFSTVKDATDDFSEDNKLGQGGFGPVYKGMLENGQEIAVKRLAWEHGQGEREFKNEVQLVAKLQHRNLVRLFGFSIEGSERLLIYEFLPNASLDKFIFDPTKRTLLDWEKRYKIINGIAKGLLYLHEDSRLKIIHRDMKASNVLLDAEMNSKIADFGMARLFTPEETQGHTSRIVGTFSYMAPEVWHGNFSVKSDVFSFGVLVLEIVTGQRRCNFRIGDNVEGLLSYAWKSFRNGSVSDIIDSTLKAGSSSLCGDIITRSTHIGLLCVQEKVIDRPTMASVVSMLNSFDTLPVPSEPPFYMQSDYGSSSLNDVSISETVPR